MSIPIMQKIGFLDLYSDVNVTCYVFMFSSCTVALILSLAHLSRMLIGELIVYAGIRRPSVVRGISTFSNDFSSEAEKQILFI